jgi:hypothetical protein
MLEADIVITLVTPDEIDAFLDYLEPHVQSRARSTAL